MEVKKGIDHRRDNRVYFHHTAEEGTGREGTAVFSPGDEALREVFFEKKAAGVLTPGVRSIRLDTLTPVGSAGRHRIFERDREGKEGRRRETCGNDSE